MIEIDFGVEAGGKRSFKTPEDVVGYLQAQRQAWQAHPLIQGRNNQPGYRELQPLIQGWSNLETTINQHLAQQPNRPERIPQLIQSSPHLNQSFTTESELAGILSQIAEDLSHEEAGGALKFHLSPDNQPIFQQLTKAQAIGAIEFQQRRAGLSPKSIRNSRDAARKMVQSLNDDVATHRQELEEAENQHRETVEKLVAAGEQEKTDFDAWKTETDEAIAAQREDWETKYQSTYEDFTEKLKLESAVKLWGDRAEVHEANASKWQIRSMIAAGIGLAIAIGVAFGSLNLAEWLFADAFVVAEGAPLPSGLRPTWQYEVIFASAATLLYLTMFFWIMRIVVRIYMTEHHLAIDATSRSSMAHTYLALTKEGAATDQDRAIVLASLFRPQADGIVKDDGLPAITPAAILSGLAIGKPGGSSTGGVS